MNPKSDTPAIPAIRPPQKSSGSKDLIELFEAQRLANDRLYTGLRNWLAERRNVLWTPPPREHTRLVTLFDKAFELSRQAETKIELLLSVFRIRSLPSPLSAYPSLSTSTPRVD